MARLSILVLDDEPIVGKRLKPALAKSGYEVDTAETGAEAIRLIDGHDYDIVVTDMRMEGTDGLDVLRHVLDRSPRTRVIMITGFASVELAREALTLGAFDFLAKPFMLEDLRKTILRAAADLEKRAGAPPAR